MNRPILVTGAGGVSGRSMARLLAAEPEAQVVLTDLEAGRGGVSLSCDLTDAAAVAKLLGEVGPGRIYHLAGGYFPNYEDNYQVNVLATKHLLDGCLTHALSARILLIGSAAEYGVVRKEENPVREEQPLNAVSAYGLSKIFQTELMKFYCNVHTMDLVMARPFNLLGEGFSTRLFVGNLLKQVADYKAGTIAQIEVGNLEGLRDYIHVDDAVQRYRVIMERGRVGNVYNVGSGEPLRIGDLLEKLLAEHGVDRSAIVTREFGNQAKIDIPCIYSDNTKLNELCF